LDDHDIDKLICAILRGETVAWSSDGDHAFEERLARRAAYHGIMVLLGERLPDLADWPSSLREVIRGHIVGQTFWEAQHRQFLAEVVSKLAVGGIQPVFIKGTALAYSIYANSAWRTRGDTDLYVSKREFDRAADLIVSAGFQRDSGVPGELVSYQAGFTRDAGPLGRHSIDLHRAISNSGVLSRLIGFDELLAGAVPLPALCEGALAAGPVHALLLACFHPATHKTAPYYSDGIAYLGSGRLIWHYDLHLMAKTLTQAQWRQFVEQAQSKGLCAISLEALQRTAACLQTPIPSNVIAGLTACISVGREPIAVYMNATSLHKIWLDFQDSTTLSSRLQFLRELAFPPPAYMRAKFGGERTSWLPWLYVLRAFGGIVRRRRRERK
jgi:Uncharacterised nucleotidyltransferase